MKKKVWNIVLIIFFSPAITYAQIPTGDWYMINGSGLIEITYRHDSIVTQKLNVDFTPKSSLKKIDIYSKALFLPDRIILLGKLNQDNDCYRKLLTIFNIQPRISYQVALNEVDTCTYELKNIESLSTTNITPLFGYTIFSKEKLLELSKLKSIDNLSLEELLVLTNNYREKFNNQYVKNDTNRNELESKKFKILFMTQVLYESGLNPMITLESINIALDKLRIYPELMLDINNMRP